MTTKTKKCSIEGCEKAYLAKGHCTMHYQRAKSAKDLPMTADPIDRFPKTVCTRPDCERQAKALGLCPMHYNRFKYTDIPLDSPPLQSFQIGECSHPGCDEPKKKIGYCGYHASRFYRGFDMDAPKMYTNKTGEPCSVEGCVKLTKANNLCVMHYTRVRAGKPLGPADRIRNGKGDGYIDSGGYKVILINGKRQGEHRHAMEQHLGRDLIEGENVHHINGNRLDNRIENLELWSTTQPAGQRVADKVAWAKELLALYEPEVLAA